MVMCWSPFLFVIPFDCIELNCIMLCMYNAIYILLVMTYYRARHGEESPGAQARVGKVTAGNQAGQTETPP